MNEALLRRLKALEQSRRQTPELKVFWQADGESWEQLRQRGEAWQAEKPGVRLEPYLIGRRDDEGNAPGTSDAAGSA